MEQVVTADKKFDDVTVTYYAELADCLGNSQQAMNVLLDYISNNTSPEIITVVAQRYFKLQKYDESISYYRRVVELNPRDTDAIIDLSRILFTVKSREEALNELTKGLEVNKDNLDLLGFLVSYYNEIKEYDKAIAVENKIIGLEYKRKHLANRALLYELLRNRKEAYEDYKRIVALEKCDLEYYKRILQYEFDNRLYDNIIRNSQKLISCNKEYESIVLNGLCMASFFQKDFFNGNKYLEKRLKQNPDNFNPYYLKVLTLFEQKNYGEIIKYTEKALSATDLEEEGRNSIAVLKVGYYILREDYDGLIAFYKLREIKTLGNNNGTVTILTVPNGKSEIKTNFNKETGVIKV